MSTILFVDDQHALRTVFAETLRSAGHVVLEAGTMADAEYLVERQRGAVDLLIVEAVLTTTNGHKIAEHFQPIFPPMQVLFVSEQSSAILFREGLLPQGAHFLHKPFDAEALIAAVQRLATAPKAPAPKPAAKRAGARRTRTKTHHAGSRKHS